MSFRLLAELTIEKPPISSTLIFVCGGPLELLRVSSSLSGSEPDVVDALARFRDWPPFVLPRGGRGCFELQLLLLLRETEEEEEEEVACRRDHAEAAWRG